jgi:hypothetical protein
MEKKKKQNPLKSPLARNILSALAVAVFGFILLNLTFLFDALYQGIIRRFIGLFIPLGPEMDMRWLPALFHGSFAVVIGIISWFVFRTKLKPIYKAIYMTVPAAVVLVTVGMFLYRWPALVYSVGGLLCLSTLYYFYRTKQPWIYYYAVVLVGVTLAVFTLAGGEI